MTNKTKLLVTFPNPNPERDYTIIHTAPEFIFVFSCEIKVVLIEELKNI